MYEALTYQGMLKEIAYNVRNKNVMNDTIGILVTRPDLPTGKEILNSLEYFHFRTGKTINFYLPGYGAYWPRTEYSDRKEVVEIDGVKWFFSNEKFVQYIEDLEKYSKWEYSGESELLLIELKEGKLSYKCMLQFYLDNMIRDGVIVSIHQFFEKVMRICSQTNSAKQISNAMGIDKAKQIMRDKLLEKLPADMGIIFGQERYFCVRNLE
ncbi:hypothetical protein [Hominiventricola aquisgranensis]|uniref:Uncharacterized protein n=1 Tax=Hominiventricola aquisgranensis TaxID=3133164 RepID=A0ABV1HWU7_9FIRM